MGGQHIALTASHLGKEAAAAGAPQTAAAAATATTTTASSSDLSRKRLEFHHRFVNL
jgi:hypothetical protein